MARARKRLAVARDPFDRPDVDWRTIRYESHFAKLCHESHDTFDCTIDVPWDPSWFRRPTNEYVPAMAACAMGLCLSSYMNMPADGYGFIHDSLAALDLDDIDLTSFHQRNGENPSDFRDSINLVAWGLGHRTVVDAQGMERTLVVMVVRGTSHTIEWDSNADVADFVVDGDYDVDYHEGFRRSADEALEGLGRYLRRHSIDGREALLWLVGHSRGASVANLMGASLDEDRCGLGFSADRLWCHTFACSLGTRRADASSTRFSNIINVNSPEDYIPRIPLRAWGFRRFGQDLYLPSICTDPEGWRRLRRPFLELFRAMTQVDFPAFHGFGPTNRFAREAANISPDLATMYGPARFSHGGRMRFSEYFRIFCDVAGSHHMGRAKDAGEMARYATGPFAHFLAFFLRAQIASNDAPGAHQEEGYLAKLLLCDRLAIPLTTRDTQGLERWTIWGEADVEVLDGTGEVVASIHDHRRDQSLYEREDYLPMESSASENWSTVWVPRGEGHTIRLRAKEATVVDVTGSREDAEGKVLGQEAWCDVAVPAEGWVELGEALSREPDHRSAADERFDITVATEGGADVDALGVQDCRWGDHGTIHAYRAHGDRFLGWFEKNEAGEWQLVSKERTHHLRVTGPRHLVARFEERRRPRRQR